MEKLTDDEKKLYHFVADMRIAEFELFLNRLGIVQFWQENYGTVLFEPLAQHYGIETEWLDITSNLDVALFFATCKYDIASKQWRPLAKADTEVNEKMKYGAIFHIPGWQADTTQMTAGLTDEYNSNVILPIGYQPFMRCHSQHGYGICMKKLFPLQEDIKFEKLRFRHDEGFSKEIFEKITDLSELELQELMNNSDGLKIFGSEIIITDEEPIRVSRQRIRACNRRYEGFSIEKNYGIQLFTRMTYVPPANKEE